MAKQSINVGTAANDKKGDSLRAAFQKVNANFTELYTELGLANDVTLSLGAFEFAGSVMSTTDSTPIVIDQSVTVSSDLTIGGDLLPNIANGGNLGSVAKPFRSLYVSNNTVFFGGVPLSLEAGSNTLKINNVPISQTIDISDLTDTEGLLGGGGVTSYNDLTNKPTLFSGSYNDLTNKPTLFGGSYNDLTNKPNLAGTYQFSVAADDSTQRVISTDEVIKFVGAGGITTASDAEGNITISKTSELVSATVPTVGSTASAGEAGITYSNKIAIFTEGAFTVGVWTDVQPGWTVTDNNGFTDTIASRGGFGAASFVTTVNNWPAPASGKTYVFTSPGYQLGYTNPIEITVGNNNWSFNNDGSLTFPDNTVQTTAAESFSFSVAADDSTQRAISNNELIKFIGAGGITTSSDAEGYITITGSGGSVSSLVNSTKTLSLGSDGSLTSNGALTIKTPNGIPTSVSNWVGGGGWNSPPYSNLATTGGTGTGLTVNVSAADGGYININYITIATAGTGYTAGDVITITNENNIPGTFTIGVAGTRDWQFGIDGGLTLPLNGIIQSVQSGNYQSKVTVSPLQILSQARTSQAQSYTVAGEAFTSASGDGAGLITFVNPSGSMTEFLIDTMEYGGVYERTVRINGAGPEYQYNYFNSTDTIVLTTYPAAGAVTDIRFSYTKISKIDISPDEGVFNIQSESGLDMDIQSGGDLDIVANEKVYMISGTNMRLQAGNGNVQISTNYAVPNATQRDWQFDTGGQLTLPNGAVLRNTVNGAIAFGTGAGHQPQGATAISIGYDAGYYTQGADAVAIGRSAGENYQGANAIAIGLFAGQTDQAANSIVLNATGVALEQTTANTFTVAPIRNISATSGVLQYNSSTKEVSYSLNVTAETFNTDQITIVGNRISTTVTNANLELECNGTGGVVINTVAEATTASTARSVGYLGIPASAVTTTATLTIADAGEHIYLTSTGQTITIPANASVAYPVGTTLTFIAGPSATTATIAITTDTMYLAGTGTTGSRTLAAHGMATAVKVAATTWYINGTGLT
jgi:hypothetical protein